MKVLRYQPPAPFEHDERRYANAAQKRAFRAWLGVLLLLAATMWGVNNGCP